MADGQVSVAASLQPLFNGKQAIVVSIAVLQRSNGQILVLASVRIKHSGAIVDPVFEDNRIVVNEIIQPILWRD